eukprot:scaffold228208_cov63-Attheya_sp.AAC.2
MADHFRKQNEFVSWEEAPGEFRTVSSNTLTLAHCTTAAAQDEEKWDAISKEKRITSAWVVMLIEAGYRIKIVPVEFVEYDETLYRTLVDYGASNGHVSLLDEELGPM